MSEQIDLLKQLLKYIESYENEVGNYDIREFSIYLKDKVLNDIPVHFDINHTNKEYKNYKVHPEVEFSTLLVQLYKFAKHYVKKVFQDKPWNTIDEYGFLASLLLSDSMSKNELINMHMIEISSGSEMIKRLIRNGLIYEFDDENDKRMKRVALTPTGRVQILGAFEDMFKVSQIIIGNLSESEMREALGTLNKLSIFHKHVHEEDRNTEVDELYMKYIAERN